MPRRPPHLRLRGTTWQWRRRLTVAKRSAQTVWIELSLFTSDRQAAATAGAALDATYGMLMHYRDAIAIDDHLFARVMQAARDLTRAEIRTQRAQRAAARARDGLTGELPPRPARQSTESAPIPPGQLDVGALMALAASAADAPDASGRLAAVPAELSAQLQAAAAALPPAPPQPLRIHHGVTAAATSAAARLRLLEQALAAGDHHPVEHALPLILKELSVEAEGTARHVLGEAALKGMIEAWHGEHDRLSGAFPGSAELARAARATQQLADAPIAPQPPRPADLATTGVHPSEVDHTRLGPGMLLSAAFAQYCQSKEIEAAWTDDSKRDAETAVRLFCELVGDKPLREIVRADALHFRTQLSRISSDWGQSRLYADPQPGNPHRRVNAQRAIEISEGRTGIQRLSLKTINKQTSTLNGLWDWARANAGCKHVDHPFEGLQKKAKGRQRRAAANVARKAFQVADLHRIFSSNRWLAQMPFTDQAQSSLLPTARPSLYFGPLLGAYGGLRLAEVVQLRVGDVTVHDGYAMVRIGKLEDAPYATALKRSRHEKVEDPNKVKTDAAKRSVPVHPVLIRQGFVRYLELRGGKPSDLLFTDVNDGVKDLTKNLSRFFRMLKRELGFDDKKTFHSFRHSVRTMLDSILRDKARTSLLIGHEDGEASSEVADIYNKGWWTRPLFEDISKLSYGIPAFGEDPTFIQQLMRDGFVLTQEPLPALC